MVLSRSILHQHWAKNLTYVHMNYQSTCPTPPSLPSPSFRVLQSDPESRSLFPLLQAPTPAGPLGPTSKTSLSFTPLLPPP